MIWYGTASFFNNCPTSPPGGGACGTCFATLGGVAYPHLNGFPGDYSYYCAPEPPPNNGGLPAMNCGDYLPIWSTCYSRNIQSEIVDHGPGAACTLDQVTCPFTYRAYRLLDLTPVTFSNLGGDPNAGLMMTEFQTP